MAATLVPPPPPPPPPPTPSWMRGRVSAVVKKEATQALNGGQGSGVLARMEQWRRDMLEVRSGAINGRHG